MWDVGCGLWGLGFGVWGLLFGVWVLRFQLDRPRKSRPPRFWTFRGPPCGYT